MLQDEHQAIDLELTHLSIQNDNLKVDNASLLQRWIESKNEEASRMNDQFAREEAAVKAKSKSAKGRESDPTNGGASA